MFVSRTFDDYKRLQVGFQGDAGRRRRIPGPRGGPGSVEHQAALHVALGNAFQTLGERESGTERLEQCRNPRICRFGHNCG